MDKPLFPFVRILQVLPPVAEVWALIKSRPTSETRLLADISGSKSVVRYKKEEIRLLVFLLVCVVVL